MARRRLLTNEQWAALLALPRDERDIVRHCTLAPDDLAVLATKRAAHNRIGHALLLCAMRHPGRILDSAEVPSTPMVAYVARQVGADPSAFHAYAGRAQTRREQIAELMRRHGFRGFGPPEAKALLAWLTPIAQINRKPAHLVAVLLDELRRQRILLPPPLLAELVVHHARARAERITYRALTDGMGAVRTAALDSLLTREADAAGPPRMAWLRQSSSSPAARNLLGLIKRIEAVRDLDVNRDREAAVPPAAFDALAGEGLRMTVQHLRDLMQPRRTATLVAAVIRLETELADAALLMADKLMGGLFRKAERKAADAAAGALRDAQGQLRVLARAGRAVIAAHEGDADPVAAVEQAVGWAQFLRAVAEAEDLARPQTVDVRAELVQRWPAMRQELWLNLGDDGLREAAYRGG